MSERNDEEIVEPDGTTNLHRKFHIHVACICLGVVAAIVVSYIPVSGKIFSHFALGMPLVPSIAQEVLDRLFSL